MSIATSLLGMAASDPKGMMADPIGTVTDQVTGNPYSTAGSLIGNFMTPGYGLIASGIGRGIDSYQQSNAADETLSNDIGISPEGPDIGVDRTTSAFKDFFGYDARDQMGDIRDAAETFYNESQVFDPSLAQGDEYGPGMVTSTPGLEVGVTTTNTFNAPTSTAKGAFYNSGPKGAAAQSLWQNPNTQNIRDVSPQYVNDPMAGYYGAENMSVSEYTDSAAQAADIAAAQAAFDNDASSGDGGWDGEGGGWGGGWGADDGGEGGFDDGGWW